MFGSFLAIALVLAFLEWDAHVFSGPVHWLRKKWASRVKTPNYEDMQLLPYERL